MEVDTTTRWYTLIIPTGYDHVQKRPLVLAFHPGNASMGEFYNGLQGFREAAEGENWIMAIPNGSNFSDNRGASTWNAVHCCNPSLRLNVDDFGFVRRMIDTLPVTLKIDATRIYAIGGSNGGMLTHRLAAEMPDVFAAVEASAGTISGKVDSLSSEVTVQPTQPIPIMMSHGLHDRNVNYF